MQTNLEFFIVRKELKENQTYYSRFKVQYLSRGVFRNPCQERKDRFCALLSIEKSLPGIAAGK